MNQPPFHLNYHQATFDLLDTLPVVSPQALETLERLEQKWHIRLPAGRDWLERYPSYPASEESLLLRWLRLAGRVVAVDVRAAAIFCAFVFAGVVGAVAL